MSANSTPYYKLYQRSSCGTALIDALDSLIHERKIAPQLARKVLEHFDRAINENLESQVMARTTCKGSLDTYRFCDEVWTFIIKNASFKMENNVIANADKIKIVACSSKLSTDNN